MRKVLPVSLMVAMGAAGALAQEGTGSWIPRANMLITRSEAVGALIGDRIYVAGGFSSAGGGAQELQYYHPPTNMWSAAAKMPVGMHHPNVAAVQGKLYVLGGCDHGSRSGPMPNNSPWLGSHHAFEYDPATDKWRTLKPLPHSSAAGALVEFRGKLYLIGGVDTAGIVLDLVQEYDPATETWRERARMPIAREHFGAALLDTLIYVVAGREKGLGGVSITAFQAYNPVTDQWQTLPNLPTARSGLSLAAAKGRLYAIGGEWPGTFDLNEEYDPARRTWRTVAKMANRRHGFTAVTYKDTIFAMGMVQASEAFLPPGNAVSLAPAPPRGGRRPAGATASALAGRVDGMRSPGAGRDALGRVPWLRPEP